MSDKNKVAEEVLRAWGNTRKQSRAENQLRASVEEALASGKYPLSKATNQADTALDVMRLTYLRDGTIVSPTEACRMVEAFLTERATWMLASAGY